MTLIKQSYQGHSKSVIGVQESKIFYWLTLTFDLFSNLTSKS